MQKLNDLLKTIDTAYQVAAGVNDDVAALLLLASLNVSEKIEAASGRADRRRSVKAA